MHPAYQVHSTASPPSSSSRPNKVVLQRQYREKEGECFSALRDVIKQLSGEDLQKRQEILQKAIDLLSTVLVEIRKQRDQVTPGPTGPADVTAGQTHLGYSAQLSLETWQTNIEFDAQSTCYTAYGQQCSPMSNIDMDPALVLAHYHWLNYHQH